MLTFPSFAEHGADIIPGYDGRMERRCQLTGHADKDSERQHWHNHVSSSRGHDILTGSNLVHVSPATSIYSTLTIVLAS